jgi:hypothetical protein
MSTTTFVTPEVPFRDFADYNPGHGTQTVRENVQWTRQEFAATRIKTVTTPVGHQFIVTGPIVDIARLAALYDQNPDGSPSIIRESIVTKRWSLPWGIDTPQNGGHDCPISNRATEDLMISETLTLTAPLRVREMVHPNAPMPARIIKPGTKVTITYNPGATNAGVTVFRKSNGAKIDRDFLAHPEVVTEDTGLAL